MGGPVGGLAERLLRGLASRPRGSLGEALEEALARSVEAAVEAAEEARGLAERLLEEAERRRLLRALAPAEPPGPVYGVDGGLARTRWGQRLVAVLHAVAVPMGRGGEPLHLAAVVAVDATGPGAEEAVEASLVALETAAAAEALRREPGAVLFLDGPVADPPWFPGSAAPPEVLGEAASQLLPGLDPGEALEVLRGVHRARAEAFAGARVVGVVKRLTGALLGEALGAPGLGDAEAAASLAALLRARAGGGEGAYAVGPLGLTGGVYDAYTGSQGGLEAVYVLLPGAGRWFRVETWRGMGLEAAAWSLEETLPGPWLPEPVLAAHRAARVPGAALRLARTMLAARAAGDPVLEALLLPGG